VSRTAGAPQAAITYDQGIEESTEVSIVGVVRADDQLLHAPLTGELCVVHATHAHVWNQLDFAAKLVDEFTVVAGVAFALDTPDGAMMIDTASCHVVGARRRFVPPYPAALHALLAQRQVDRYAASTFADHVLVVPGDRVAIRGVVVREPGVVGGERGYRDAGQQLKIAGYPQRPLEIRIA
jgi:hypothetical protein